MDNMTWHRHSSAAVTGRGESTERFQCCDHALFFHPGASYSVPRRREAESSIPATMSGSSQKDTPPPCQTPRTPPRKELTERTQTQSFAIDSHRATKAISNDLVWAQTPESQFRLMPSSSCPFANMTRETNWPSAEAEA